MVQDKTDERMVTPEDEAEEQLRLAKVEAFQAGVPVTRGATIITAGGEGRTGSGENVATVRTEQMAAPAFPVSGPEGVRAAGGEATAEAQVPPVAHMFTPQLDRSEEPYALADDAPAQEKVAAVRAQRGLASTQAVINRDPPDEDDEARPKRGGEGRTEARSEEKTEEKPGPGPAPSSRR